MEQQPNSKGNTSPKQPAPRRARLRLPFENRKQDPVDWVYENRFGICATLIILLIFMVVCFWVRIGGVDDTKLNKPQEEEAVYIDLSEMQILKQEQTPVEESEISREDWRSVKNVESNENAAEGEALRNVKSTDAELERLKQAAANNAETNLRNEKKGLNDIEAMINDASADKKDSNTDKKSKSEKVDGNVTVEYSFTNPVRHSTKIVKPAYLMEEGGKVVVEAVLNQSGKVISARAISGGNERMRRVAEESARASTFNIDSSAPSKQKGTITYIFIPQY